MCVCVWHMCACVRVRVCVCGVCVRVCAWEVVQMCVCACVRACVHVCFLVRQAHVVHPRRAQEAKLEPGQSGGGCLKKRRRLVGAGASMDAPPSACRRDPPSLTEEAL